MNALTTDIVIIGAGPAGIFAALSLLEAEDGRHITIIEKGLPVEQRSCPKAKTGVCVNCQPCRITTGFSGAGAFSDGKLSLSHEVGGNLPELIDPVFGARPLKRLIQKEIVDRIANQMVGGQVLDGATVTIDLDTEGNYTCVVKNVEGEAPRLES